MGSQHHRGLRSRQRGLRGGNTHGERSAPRIRWTGLRPMFDFWGVEIKRFYQLETLARATEWMIQTNSDRFLISSIQQALGPSPVISLAFDLFQEGKYQLIFRLRAVNAKRKEGSFAFVVAKHADEYSKVARMELANLQVLYQRAPKFVVKPFRGGHIYLPDRHKRESHGREIYGYVTQWLNGYHELGLNRDLQFIINTQTPHTFTIAQTELLKAQMVEIVARTFHAAKRDCMEMPQVASGDFVVTASAGTRRLKLIACRRMLPNVNPAKLIHRIISAKWDWGGKVFRLIPVEPEAFFAAFVRAVGVDVAALWFREYADAVRAGRFAEQDVMPLELIQCT